MTSSRSPLATSQMLNSGCSSELMAKVSAPRSTAPASRDTTSKAKPSQPRSAGGCAHRTTECLQSLCVLYSTHKCSDSFGFRLSQLFFLSFPAFLRKLKLNIREKKREGSLYLNQLVFQVSRYFFFYKTDNIFHKKCIKKEFISDRHTA